jgi:hypothetical protein
MAIRSGTLVKITIGGTEITNLTTTGFSLSTAQRNTTTKDDGAFDSFLPTRTSGTMSGSVLFEESATYGYEDMFDAQIAGTIVTALYTTGVTTEKEYSASAFFTEVTQEDPDADNSVVNFTLQLTGTVAKATIS